MNRGNASNLKCGNTKKSLSVLSSKEVCVLKFSQCEFNMKAVLRRAVPSHTVQGSDEEVFVQLVLVPQDGALLQRH